MGKPTAKYRTKNPYIGGRKKVSRRRTKQTPPAEQDSDSFSHERRSATAKKFDVFGIEIPEQKVHESQERMYETEDCYLFVQKSVMEKLLSTLLCPDCMQPGVAFKICEDSKSGFSIKSNLFCPNCELFSIEEHLCNRVGGSTSVNVPWDINTRAVLAFRGIGCGHSAMRQWASVMNLPYSLSNDAYKTGHKRIEESSTKVFSDIAAKSRVAIEKAYSELGVYPDDDGVLNVAVSYDGSWQKRGFSSHNGMGSVIELVTGLPLDYEVLSNFCFKCKALDNKEPSQEWMKKHKENCPKNFDGSASAMEAEGAKRLWSRSIQKNQLRYTTILSDGDSKAYDAVTSLNVYGQGVKIEKEDCINHVSKRMGTALRSIVAESKAQQVSIAGKGKLTKEKIAKIQNYYGRAIKDYASDIPLLKNRIMAILLHLSSTDAHPKHAQCPPGLHSWCFWQRALANKKDPGPHRDHETLPTEVGKKLVPIFRRLSDEQLLKRCSRSMTQNANESLHNLVWRLCPKATFVGRKTLQTAVSLAICQFSMGATFQVALCKALNIVPGAILESSAVRSSAERLRKAEKAASDKVKKQRKKLKYEKQSQQKSRRNKEGKTYVPGGFDI